MGYVAKHRYAQISPRKVRVFADLVRGMFANEALELLSCYPNRGARLLEKVIRSALANAEDKRDSRLRYLTVSVAKVDSGPISKRWRPKARGSSTVIIKRTSHLTIELD